MASEDLTTDAPSIPSAAPAFAPFTLWAVHELALLEGPLLNRAARKLLGVERALVKQTHRDDVVAFDRFLRLGFGIAHPVTVTDPGNFFGSAEERIACDT